MEVSPQGIIQQHQGDETPLKRATMAHQAKEQYKKYPRHLQLVIAKKGGLGGAASKRGIVGKKQLPIKHSVTPTAENSVRNHFYFPPQQESSVYKVIDPRKIKVIRDGASPGGHANEAYQRASKTTFERT